ncbi:hypothetical protein VoSk93_02700 [Vibrio owensii]
MLVRRFCYSTFFTLVSTIIYPTGHLAIGAERQTINPQYAPLLSHANTNGSVRIIAKLAEHPKAIRTASIASTLASENIIPVKALHNGNYEVFDVSAFELEQLINSGYVEVMYEDTISYPTLSDSLPLTGTDLVHDYGYTGKGQTVVILDSGMDRFHPEFVNRIIEEACFSTNYANDSSLCPNGTETQYGLGAAQACDLSMNSVCEHGTAVGGVAVGQSGMAPDANIVSIQVFSKPNNGEKLGSYLSDQIRALSWVRNELAQKYDIASINISIGSGQYIQYCDNYPISNHPLGTEIKALKDLGIATVVGAGNDGYTNAIAMPSCMQHAIAVGSSSHNDIVSSFSNTASMLDLLAPGAGIRSAYIHPTQHYNYFTGTSMAAPHVSGAFALLAEAAPSSTVNERELALEQTGVMLVDNKTAEITKPRIQVDKAIDSLISPENGTTEYFIYQVKGPVTGLTLSSDYKDQYSFEIDWDGDGIFDLTIDSNYLTTNGYEVMHHYPTEGVYSVQVKGHYPYLQPTGTLIDVTQWGKNVWKSTILMFYDQNEMTVSARDTPDFHSVTTMRSMFNGAKIANPDVRNWDVSNVSDMRAMFKDADAATPDVSIWDVSSVKDMSSMFHNTESANPDVSTWDVSSVTNMNFMFRDTVSANPNVKQWNVKNVSTMYEMFYSADSANPDVSDWDVSNVRVMQGMFERTSVATPDVSNWITSTLQYAKGIFCDMNDIDEISIAHWDVTNLKHPTSDTCATYN